MKKFLFPVLFSLFSLPIFSQLNMQLLDELDYPVNVNDVWGWADPVSGNEYAFVGTNTGVSIVDVSTPTDIQEVQFINGPNSTWRDIKTWGNHAYVTNETGSGILVIDMSGAPNSITWERWQPNIPGLGNLTDCHNLYIDEFGFCYLAGCNINSGGIIIVDVFTSPGNPSFEAAAPAVYAHDVFAQNNKMYTSEIYGGDLGIYDVSNKQNITLLASQQTPYNFTHNAWVNADNSVVFTTDEKANAPVSAYDITDLNDIRELDQFRPLESLNENVIPHNVHVWNNWLIISYYTDGGIIADASRPENIIEVGNWDTFLGGNGGFSGAWGAYPFLPSGLVLLSDRQTGLKVCGADYVRACWLEGTITDADSGAPIFGADIIIESSQVNFTTSDLVGSYKTGQALAGTFDVTVSATGYITQTVSVNLENGVLTTMDFQLEPIVVVDEFSGKLLSAVDSSPIGAAQVVLEGTTSNYSAFTNQNGEFLFTDIVRDDYTISAARWGNKHVSQSNLLIDENTDPVTLETHLGYQDDFFVSQGWTTETTASSGWWQRGEPVGTTSSGAQANPDEDISDDIGNQCFVTGNNGGGASNDDVDDGSVKLLSPTMDLTIYYEPVISYQSWFYNGGGNNTPPNDSFIVSISNGTEEAILEIITESGSTWNDRAEFKVSDYISITNEMKIIFEAVDSGDGHIVEAAVDAFLVSEGAFPDFSVSETMGCPVLVVEFADSSNYAYEWEWTFENGDPLGSNGSHAEVGFTMPGIYDVTLEVLTKTGATLTLNQDDLIEIFPAPVTAFDFSVSGNMVDFTNNSVNATSYFWSFNDGPGSTSDEENPSYTFSSVGSFNVTLAATNDCGTAYHISTVQIDAIPPKADFDADQLAGCESLTIEFYDESVDVPTSWQWEFPGGTPSSSTEQNPIITYETAGSYPVSLTVENSAGSNTVVVNDLIYINSAPSPGFTFVDNGGTVSFTNTTLSADNFEWHFNDGSGNTSTMESPEYTFPAAGSYEVALIATNDCGQSSITQTVFIAAVPPIPFFNNDEWLGCDSLTVQFFDESLHNPTAWYWEFEGGTPSTSTEENPVVHYSYPGIFKVGLSVTNSAGQNGAESWDVIIVAPTPKPDFNFMVDGATVTFLNTSLDADSWLWHFGDGLGSQSSEQHPSHSFPGIGNYEVILDGINDCGVRSDTAIISITSVEPTALANASVEIGCTSSTIQYTDVSEGGEIGSWQWSFPGGIPSTSTEQNPIVSYSISGDYEAQLIVTNPEGSDTATISNYVQVKDLPTADFNYVVNGPIVEFTGNAQSFDNLVWHFGDAGNSTSSEVNPQFVYANIGSYEVLLEAENECGIDSFSQIIIIEAIFPNAAFSYELSETCVPFEVNFTNESTGGQISSIEWQFPGGDPAASNEADPTVLYSSRGVYDVILKVTNSVGESTFIETSLIVAEDVPVVYFDYNIDDLEVTFTSNAQYAELYNWNFGDGEISTAEDPIYNYSDAGTYLVELTVSNNCGVSSLIDTVVIEFTDVYELNQSMVVFSATPNPFSDKIIIDYELESPFKKGEIILVDVLGEIVESKKTNKNKDQFTFGSNNLNHGIYFIYLKIDGQKTEAIKLVKMD